MGNKIIRSICYFTQKPDDGVVLKIKEKKGLLEGHGFEVQTLRFCTSDLEFNEIVRRVNDKEIMLGASSVPCQNTSSQLKDFFRIPDDLSFNLDLTGSAIEAGHVDLLFEIIRNKPDRTFNFAYVFNNPLSSPYFPSANYGVEGFSIGLQSTDLTEGCRSLNEWFEKTTSVWDEINLIFKDDQEFLGIDSSVAPVFQGNSSLINWIKRLGMTFNESVLTDTYLKITKFIKEKNPKPIGLCGLMFPCLEDFELADEYEQGNFSLERNLFLSLHSGLGVDTYPIGIDENPEKVINILKTVQGLSNKYHKPLSVRFVSDGKAKIGEKTDFKNQYLKDVIIRPLA